MAHIKVTRRSMRPEEWITLRFGWLKRYIYKEKHEIDIKEIFGEEIIVPTLPFPKMSLKDVYQELEERYGYKAEESEKDLYCKYLDKEHGWVCLQLGAFHKSSSGKKGSTGIEYVWLNYFDRIPENAKYFVSMKNHGLEKGGADNE